MQGFFEAMPPHSGGMAFVVIQHLSADFKSHMAELLSTHLAMPVAAATDGVTVEPKHALHHAEEILRQRQVDLDQRPGSGSVPKMPLNPV
jgi:chemotaxis response regulator CheB